VKLWLDQMLPRRLCAPIGEWTGCEVWHVGTEYREDEDIFHAARAAHATVLTTDSDFVSLLERLGAPPQLIWLRVGNCSNQELERILKATLPTVLEMLAKGEPIVEVTGAVGPRESSQ
jgi:predicted nuclease of predicted toxin-antitoxin system